MLSGPFSEAVHSGDSTVYWVRRYTLSPRRQARTSSGETPDTDSGTASAGGAPSSIAVR